MYYAAVDESANMAIELGKNYETFDGSPMSKGLFQFDMWENIGGGHLVYTDEQWDTLREKASKHQYNSLLLAVMPTASTASIFNNNECIEPFTENIYTRTVLSGQFIMINKHLINDCILHNIWGNKVIEHIVNHQGSVQNLEIEMLNELNPKMTEDDLDYLKLKYRTAYEIPSKTLIDMAIMRGRYICQSQSLNAWMASPSFNKVYNWHMYGWKNGLKTGMYYLRTKAAVTPTNVSLSAIENPLSAGSRTPKGFGDTSGAECEFCSA
jgi:ribonucleoside-diphosphate reductase alpha chain